MAILPNQLAQVQTSGDTWTDLIVGEANKTKEITSIVAASVSMGDSIVAIRLKVGTNYSYLQPEAILPYGRGAKIRNPGIPLQGTTQAIQVKSVGAVDWTGVAVVRS